MSRTKLAIVGCGAVTERLLLPAAVEVSGAGVSVLADKDLGRANRLADQYGIERVVTECSDIDGRADAAIVALPNYLHAPISIELLERGIHVLVEKPMALRAAECAAMIEAASRADRVLAVGLHRRFYAASSSVKRILELGLLGEITGFDIREGHVYDWPITTDFPYRRDQAGGGVLMDLGTHMIDLLLWWLGELTITEYEDDAFGGVEANCVLRSRLVSGAKGVAEFSYMRTLRNTCRIYGERATLEVVSKFPCPLRLCSPTGEPLVQAGAGGIDGKAQESLRDVIRMEIEDFIRAITDGSGPFVPGDQGKLPVAVIESCYRLRKELNLPWLQETITGCRA